MNFGLLRVTTQPAEELNIGAGRSEEAFEIGPESHGATGDLKSNPILLGPYPNSS